MQLNQAIQPTPRKDISSHMRNLPAADIVSILDDEITDYTSFLEILDKIVNSVYHNDDPAFEARRSDVEEIKNLILEKMDNA